MLLARGSYWMASLVKGADSVALVVQKDGLPEGLQDLRELRVEVSLARWNGLVKHVLTDRRLLGGILLAGANHTEHVATAVASDLLFFELQRVILESTAVLVAQERLVLAEPASDAG